jgi:hypothetical protein
MHLDIIKVFYSPPDAQVNCLKNNIKIYMTLNQLLHVSLQSPSSGSVLFDLAKVAVETPGKVVRKCTAYMGAMCSIPVFIKVDTEPYPGQFESSPA